MGGAPRSNEGRARASRHDPARCDRVARRSHRQDHRRRRARRVCGPSRGSAGGDRGAGRVEGRTLGRYRRAAGSHGHPHRARRAARRRLLRHCPEPSGASDERRARRPGRRVAHYGGAVARRGGRRGARRPGPAPAARPLAARTRLPALRRRNGHRLFSPAFPRRVPREPPDTSDFVRRSRRRTCRVALCAPVVAPRDDHGDRRRRKDTARNAARRGRAARSPRRRVAVRAGGRDRWRGLATDRRRRTRRVAAGRRGAR